MSNDFQVSLEALLPFCEEGINRGCSRRLLFFDAPENNWIHYVPRLLMLLEGTVVVQYHENGKKQERAVTAPVLLFCAQSGWMHISERPVASRMLSFSYYPSYIRAMHIDFDGIHKPPTARDIYYHSSTGLSAPGTGMLHVIDLLHAAGCDQIATEMLSPLLQFTVQELRSSAAAPVVKVRRLWEQINTFMRDHRHEAITRSHIARLFQISPGYVSDLCKEYTGSSFSDLKLHYQMKHAEHLLQHTRLAICEIAAQSGFAEANYFIRRFKKVYGMTPHAYRNHPPKTQSSTPL